MSQQASQQATKNKRTISFTTIRFYVAIEKIEESKRNLSQHRKIGRNRVDRLKEENVCRDKENYFVRDPEVGGHKKLATNIFCVVTKRNHVATQLRLLHHNFVTTVSKSVVTEFK